MNAWTALAVVVAFGAVFVVLASDDREREGRAAQLAVCMAQCAINATKR